MDNKKIQQPYNKLNNIENNLSSEFPRCLIAGLGSIGRRHLHNLKELGCSDFVLYRTGKSTLPNDELKSFSNETDLKVALAHNPQAAIIANPTSLHLPVSIAAARSGCHLLIEKPVSHTLENLSELVMEVERKKIKVLVGFQFRFHPGLCAIKQLLEKNAIGQIVSAHAHWGEYLPDWHPWEDYSQSYSTRADLGGGVILTLCHPLDYLRWLLGEVKAVSAMLGRLGGLKSDTEDTANISLQFESGAIATVHLDYIQRPSSHWIEIIGQNGTIRWNNADGSVHCYYPEQEQWEIIPAPINFERNTMFLKEMRHFLDCIEGLAEPLVTLNDGIRALEIALAAKRSIAEGRIIEV